MTLFYAKHLLAASVMAAPGAIVISKIFILKQKKLIQMSQFHKIKLDLIF